MEHTTIPAFQQTLFRLWESIITWVSNTLFTQETIIELAICTTMLFASSLIAKHLHQNIKQFQKQTRLKPWHHSALRICGDLLFPFTGVILLWLYALSAEAFNDSHTIADIITSILIAWILLSLATSLIGTSYLVKWVKIVVITAVALNVLGLLDGAITFLDSIALTLGKIRISLFTILKGFIVFIFLLWITFSISKGLEKQIHKSSELTPSLKVLFSKLTKIVLFTITFLIALNTIGLDLTLFTVFGGAIGVGVGFGLQKVVSNFISGIILLSDRSIKPGDVIAVGETYGWVNALGARYVSVITRDGKEHLIPNESLITEKVENWSFSNNDVRIRIPIGVSYNTDVRKAADIIVEAAKNTPRTLQTPEPRCLFREFGDSSINLELRVWINDPVNGMGNIQSELLFNIWDKFKEHNIEVPFPQRDIHIRSQKNSITEGA